MNPALQMPYVPEAVVPPQVAQQTGFSRAGDFALMHIPAIVGVAYALFAIDTGMSEFFRAVVYGLFLGGFVGSYCFLRFFDRVRERRW